MKNFITLCILLLNIFYVHASEVSFDFANNEFKLPVTTNTNNHDGDITAPIAKDGVVITCQKGTATLGPLMFNSTYNNTTDLRFYKGSSMVFSTSNGEAIKQIAFTSNGKLAITTETEGDYIGDTYETFVPKTPSGEITFSVTDKAQIYKIVVTTESGTVVCATPTFLPVAGELFKPTNITINCVTEGADIYYTTDGSTPSKSSIQYTSPFEINSGVTITAIAYKGESSSLTNSAAYTFPAYTNVANIAGFIANSSVDELVKINTAVTAVYQSGKYLYVKDNSGYALVYGDLTSTFAPGEQILQGIVGSPYSHYGNLQFMPKATTFESLNTFVTVEPQEVSIADCTLALVNHYVIGKKWTVKITKSGNDKIYTLTDAFGNTMPVFERFKNITMPDEDGTYDVTGFVNTYDGTLQMYPTNFDKKAGITDASINNSIYGATESVRIISTETGIAEIYNLGGQLASYTPITEGENSIALNPGFYIVKIGSKISKVIVR